MYLLLCIIMLTNLFQKKHRDIYMASKLNTTEESKSAQPQINTFMKTFDLNVAD